MSKWIEIPGRDRVDDMYVNIELAYQVLDRGEEIIILFIGSAINLREIKPVDGELEYSERVHESMNKVRAYLIKRKA